MDVYDMVSNLRTKLGLLVASLLISQSIVADEVIDAAKVEAAANEVVSTQLTVSGAVVKYNLNDPETEIVAEKASGSGGGVIVD
jgi:hypothetical protein